ncbi:MAG TPA: hypothetical protein PKA24_18565, partial [Microthrixaceae bacterium]|nr:hypothetical protein [Microthrixaceae bacterium]
MLEELPDVVTVQCQRSKFAGALDAVRQRCQFFESACHVARPGEQPSEPSDSIAVQSADPGVGCVCVQDCLSSLAQALVVESRVVIASEGADTGLLSMPFEQLPRHECLALAIAGETIKHRAEFGAGRRFIWGGLFTGELVPIPCVQSSAKAAPGAWSSTNHGVEGLTNVIGGTLREAELVGSAGEVNQLPSCAEAPDDPPTFALPEFGDDTTRDDFVD